METEMFDDKIGDVYSGGSKIGEVRGSDDGGCYIFLGIVLAIILIPILIYCVIMIGIDKIQQKQANSVEYGANAYYATDYLLPNANSDASAPCDESKCEKGAVDLSAIGKLNFTDINVSSSGKYVIKLVYTTSNDTGQVHYPLHMKVNGRTLQKIDCVFNQTSSSSMDSTEVTVSLKNGDNTISFSGPGDPPFYLNRIEVKAA